MVAGTRHKCNTIVHNGALLFYYQRSLTTAFEPDPLKGDSQKASVERIHEMCLFDVAVTWVCQTCAGSSIHLSHKSKWYAYLRYQTQVS